MIIKVPYPELYQRSATIRSQAEIVRQEIQSLDAQMQSLEWMGNRASHFQQNWNNAKPQMVKWAEALEAFADDLHNQAQRMERADNNF